MFGGSFDPPHIGHFICARVVAETLGLERILVVPTSIQPHKPGGPSAPDEVRWAMVKAATAVDPLFEPVRMELDRKGISYSVDTLESLAGKFPPEKFSLFWIIGSDAAAEIAEWKNPDRIVELAKLTVMKRRGWDENTVPSRYIRHMSFVETPVIEVSSTEIRRRVHDRLPVNLMVIPAVNDIISEHNLYQ